MRFVHLAGLLGSALALVVACSGSEEPAVLDPETPVDGGDASLLDAASPPPSDASPTDAPVVDATVDAPFDAAAACEAALEAPDASRACYTGPANTLGHGPCAEGEKVCSSTGEVSCQGEVLPATETCNEADDDCDGLVDEDFDLSTSPEHCGACNVACGAGCACAGGLRVETDCSDGQDNDGDGATDCADPSCAAQSCGAGCLCLAGEAHELDCSDNLNNDDNDGTDCADRSDCDNKSCGAGCVCSGGVRKETVCNDGLDNDGDGTVDCQDVVDCPIGSACKRGDGFVGSCKANRSCQ